MADISIKYDAFCAGLGSYGINHLLITDAYGPRVRMTAIITDAPLGERENSFRPLLFEGCRDCMKCIEACPVTAFTADGMIDRHRCAEYMFQTLGGLRCGLCVKACPAGRRGLPQGTRSRFSGTILSPENSSDVSLYVPPFNTSRMSPVPRCINRLSSVIILKNTTEQAINEFVRANCAECYELPPNFEFRGVTIILDTPMLLGFKLKKKKICFHS